MLANALSHNAKTASPRGRARWPKVFGNALGNSVVGAMQANSASDEQMAALERRHAALQAQMDAQGNTILDDSIARSNGQSQTQIGTETNAALAGYDLNTAMVAAEAVWRTTQATRAERMGNFVAAEAGQYRAMRQQMESYAAAKAYRQQQSQEVAGVLEAWNRRVAVNPPGTVPPPYLTAQAPAGFDWKGLGSVGDKVSHAATVAEQGLLYAAKKDGQEILRSAWTLQKDRMVKVAAADDMADTLKIFKNPDGKSATALAASAGKYAAAFKGVAVVGWGATAVEEGSYVMDTYNTNPDKVGYAVGASVTNVAGDMSAVYLGMAGGAEIGAIFAPWTLGISIPVGAVIGGIGGHFFYDGVIKPEVREGWTGIKQGD